jgi:hypothetical protein
MDGDLSLVEPNANYDISGSCEQIGNFAEVELRLNGGQPYEARVYVGDDGRIYLDGEQEGTGIKFAFVRD